MNVLNMKNRYCHRSHISEKRFREIIRLFAMDMEASKIAQIAGVSRNAVNRILKALRRRIAEWCEFDSPWPSFRESDEVESCVPDSIEDEGQRGLNDQRHVRRTKIPAIGIARHSDKIFTRVLPEYSRKEIADIIQGKAPGDGGLRKGDFSLFHGIVDTGGKKLYRITQGGVGSAHKPTINSIDVFWGAAKMRLIKFRGLNRNTFYLHLKETEFRFNNRNDDLHELILILLRKEPLRFS